MPALPSRLPGLFRPRPAPYGGPAGERLYAVGDVHGRLDLLDDLLARIADDLEARPADGAVLAFLGDYIDRGPDSARVLSRLIGLARSRVATHFLMGNHEEMLLRILGGQPGLLHDWLDFGGDACLASYGLSPARLAAADEADAVARLREAMPPAHLAFLGNLASSVRLGDVLLVHAGIRPGVPLESQAADDLRWIRGPFLRDRRDHGVLVIHGHTVTERVDRRPNRIGIDTGAFRTGVLTAAVVDGTAVGFLQTAGAPLAPPPGPLLGSAA